MKFYYHLFFLTTCFTLCNSCENDIESKERENVSNQLIQQKYETKKDSKKRSDSSVSQVREKNRDENDGKHKTKNDKKPKIKKSNYTCSAKQENAFDSIKTFEDLYESHKEEIIKQIQSVKEEDRIWGISDSEGKYFILYSWLRLSGLVEKFEDATWEYFDLNNFNFSDAPIGEYSEDENEKNFYLSKDGLFIRFPKLKINTNFKGTCIHLGDILDRGRNATISLLTVLYLKKQLVLIGEREKLILIIGNHELMCYEQYHENRYDILDDPKKEEVKKIVLSAIKQNLMQFFGVLEVDNKKVLLTHREISKSTVTCNGFKSMFGSDLDLSSADKFFDNIDELNKRFYNIDDGKKSMISCDFDKWKHVTKKDSENIFVNQFCGHIHHALEGKGFLGFRSGYFFYDDKSDNAIVYLDNYSTTASSGNLGLSTANVHLFDRNKGLKQGDVVFKLVDSSEDNFKIHRPKVK